MVSMSVKRKEWKKYLAKMSKKRYVVYVNGTMVQLTEIRKLILSYLYFNEGRVTEMEIKDLLSSYGVSRKNRIIDSILKSGLMIKDGDDFVLSSLGERVMEEVFRKYYSRNAVERQLHAIMNGSEYGYDTVVLDKVYGGVFL